MRRPKDDLPPPPELPSFTIEADADVPEDVSLRHDGTSLTRHDVDIAEADLDPDAAKVVRRLERAGHQAYLVGGCVRDLLLDHKPKDWDIATSARPEDVRQLFRNCRIIGRRFRLAHVLFGHGKVIEVATFRKNPAEPVDDDAVSDLLIRSDNVFGEAHEDAIRRDFTINALFYDVDRRQVLDWCGGMEHIAHRTIHTIGDPNVRFREDPVRILRAIKFAARRDLGISPAVYDAMVAHRESLGHAARPRIFEEILRLLRYGAAHRSLWLFWETGAMAQLIPELAAFLDDDGGATGGGGVERFFKKMDAIDRRIRAGGPVPDDVTLFTVLLREPLEEACDGARDKVEAAYQFLDPIMERIAIPRRISDAMRRIVSMQPRLETKRLGRLARAEHARLALDVLEIELESKGADTSHLEAMRAEIPAVTDREEDGPGIRRPKRRRRRH